MDTRIIIDGVTITNYKGIKRTFEPNETNIRTLGGNLYTDFKNTLRTWVVTWENMKRSDYDVIYELYKNQYTNNRYAVVRLDAYDLSIPAKLEISSQDIKWNGEIISNFTLTIVEQYAIS